ncbi:tyrosine-type recombinase/integrase [Micromonospora cabrerizensis]|uniref:tyrosine-type recombinase/integrase n=1 Tax=Micromonospora cabrerizensis TaxID=2911213 RepID=UPI003557493C
MPAVGFGFWSNAPAPPVRLHDLRHGAASLAQEAGADLKTLQDMLGHSSIVVTSDTYTRVLPHAQRRCADATAHLVLTAAQRTRAKIRKDGRCNRPQPRPEANTPTLRHPSSMRNPR